MISGQIFFRETDDKAPDGRRLMMFIGILALDRDIAMKGETQYAMFGRSNVLGDLSLDVLRDSAINRADEAKDMPMSDLLTHRIWRY